MNGGTMTPRITTALLFLAGVGPLEAGCAHSAHLRPELPALEMAAAATLSEDHFRRDRAGGVSEEALRAILDAPVLLDESQRVGIMPVADSYQPELGPPLTMVPAELMRSLDAAGVFQATSEVSTDWPADASIPGLRELAARYRSGYLLLYRQRFIDETYVNAWAWLYPTVIGVLVATLFDVRSGTILFTLYERVHARSDETPWDDDRKLRAMKLRLLEQGASKLAEQVVSKVRHLSALRQANERKSVASQAGPNS